MMVCLPGLLLLLLVLAGRGDSEVGEEVKELPLHILWHAPFRSGGGYCSEAYAIVKTLRKNKIPVYPFHHGDSLNYAYLGGLIEGSQDAEIARRSSEYIYPSNARSKGAKMIAVCHSEPGAWSAPVPNYHTFPCPPHHVTVDYRIGRTMFETDSLPSWTDRLSFMDEIWV